MRKNLFSFVEKLGATVRLDSP